MRAILHVRRRSKETDAVPLAWDPHTRTNSCGDGLSAANRAICGEALHRVLHVGLARLIVQQRGCHWWAREYVQIRVAIWSRARHPHWNCQLHDSPELTLEAWAQHEFRLRVFAGVPRSVPTLCA